MALTHFLKQLDKTKIIAIDTPIFIYEFNRHKLFFPFANELFLKLEKNKLKGITSLISFIEVTSFPPLKFRDDLLKAYANIFLKTPGLEMIDPNLIIGKKAAEIRRNYGIHTPDAIQIATAIINKANLFISNDESFKKVKEIKTLVLKEFI